MSEKPPKPTKIMNEPQATQELIRKIVPCIFLLLLQTSTDDRPHQVEPVEYRIKLTPDMEKFTCRGEQEVDLEVGLRVLVGRSCTRTPPYQ